MICSSDLFSWKYIVTEAEAFVLSGDLRIDDLLLEIDSEGRYIISALRETGESAPCSAEYQPVCQGPQSEEVLVGFMRDARAVLLSKLDRLVTDIARDGTATFAECIEAMLRVWCAQASSTYKLPTLRFEYSPKEIKANLVPVDLVPVRDRLCRVLNRLFPQMLEIWSEYPISLPTASQRRLDISAREDLRIQRISQSIETLL